MNAPKIANPKKAPKETVILFIIFILIAL